MADLHLPQRRGQPSVSLCGKAWGYQGASDQVSCAECWALAASGAEATLLRRLIEDGVSSVMWERLDSNGWWRAYAANHRDDYGTPEDEEGGSRMGAGPTRQEALTRLLEVVGRG